MQTLTKIFLTTALIATTLTACDKKEPAKTEAKTSASTTTTTVTTTSTTAATVSPTPTAAPAPASAPNSTPAPAVQSTSSSTVTTTATIGNSIITQAVTAGTPEATVKNAMDALMNGTAKQAASYYQVNMPDFEKVIAEQQSMVKQQLQHLDLVKTVYNKDNSKAFIVGKLTTTASPTPQEVSYKLVKVKNEWKLVE